jgi:hypothetical protein
VTAAFVSLVPGRERVDRFDRLLRHSELPYREEERHRARMNAHVDRSARVQLQLLLARAEPCA